MHHVHCFSHVLANYRKLHWGAHLPIPTTQSKIIGRSCFKFWCPLYGISFPKIVRSTWFQTSSHTLLCRKAYPLLSSEVNLLLSSAICYIYCKYTFQYFYFYVCYVQASKSCNLYMLTYASCNVYKFLDLYKLQLVQPNLYELQLLQKLNLYMTCISMQKYCAYVNK